MAQFQATTVTGDLTSTTLDMRATQSFQGYYAYWRNNFSYTVDFSNRQIGAGAAWWVSACYNHSGNAYGAGNESFLVKYSGTGAAMTTLHNYGTSQGGNIGWSSPQLYHIRCTKNAGFYPGLGGCVIQVNGPT